MVSTYVSYLSVARNLNASLSSVASQATVSRDSAYYKENIDKVTTVDEFMGDYKLYSYAMKAYGLDDMTYAKAFMKKVLESDLSDSSSFANSLSDGRYAEFAAAFKFGGETKTAQSDVQRDNLLDAYEESFDTEADDIADETDYFEDNISSITSVDEFLSSSRLKNYALTAFGLSTEYTSSSFLKQVLTSDLDDADSFVNQLGDDVYVSLARAFNFNEDGSTDGDLMSEDQISLVSSAYAVASSTIASTETGEAYDTYFAAEIGNITSVDQLMSDDKLVGYLRIAYGLSDDESDSYISAALKSADIAEAIGLSDLHDAFNFDEDGALADGDTAQTSNQTATTTAAFDENYQVLVANASTEDATDNYTTRIASVTSIDDFLVSNDDDDDDDNDDLPELWEMALRAYDIDPDSVSRSEVRKILESDPSDSKSYVNSLDDDRFVAFRKAFNFDDNGDVTVPLQAMSESVVDDYAAYYKQNKIRYLEGDELTEATDAANDEITYFREQMATITTASEFLADDRLVSFALEAKGLDPDDVTSDELEKMFSSDLDDEDSYVNKLDDNRFGELVGSFNFDQDGNISADPTGTVQQRGDVLETIDSYVRLTLEDDQGDSNTGVRLALYFERKAPEISNAYDILGDSALFEFFTTTFNLSSYVSNMDVDKQAEMVDNFIDMKDLSDPDKVDDLIQRFTAMYDMANGTGTTSSALSILTGSATISADTLLAVAQLKSS
ncbi:DUF1217 domain-containing protein [Rhizobium ruizarguesonis]|uniref:DUF1217 domain-containing protein n=1 Tax=Rhizobium ruizarguesonis TaxID=2081791 RepID=UPI00103267FE|nr:DUF1217 domain-containing protein [Rhizobium ruizarguesonis]MBY5850782.1 DUF1217 domain-containing protein [Rhizobium leguminosarum]TCA39432.1 DUF1217 domain-containing protein [Rhizobium leguminosarum bv. viciae]NEJ27175.1 DUF1217 domain-containing protein [Rhizobium ruizarguesonis]TBB17001.1 DUF1217 domain-containing protein [Rhizobium ruizarguesonis]TBC23816.1 DUF1217 domain-containing protein [Rhizobium ruizarguesonis]